MRGSLSLDQRLHRSLYGGQPILDGKNVLQLLNLWEWSGDIRVIAACRQEFGYPMDPMWCTYTKAIGWLLVTATGTISIHMVLFYDVDILS